MEVKESKKGNAFREDDSDALQNLIGFQARNELVVRENYFGSDKEELVEVEEEKDDLFMRLANDNRV